MRALLRLLVAAGICAGPAAAQTAGAFMANPTFRGPPPAQCVTTFEMQHCAAHDLRKADAAMSRAYFSARQRLRPVRQRDLLGEQRAWLRHRDAYCLRQNAGSTAGPLAVAHCWVGQTEARAAFLRGLRR